MKIVEIVDATLTIVDATLKFVDKPVNVCVNARVREQVHGCPNVATFVDGVSTI